MQFVPLFPKPVSESVRRRLGDGGVRKRDATNAVTYRLLQQFESCTREPPCCCCFEDPSAAIEGEERRESKEERLRLRLKQRSRSR